MIDLAGDPWLSVAAARLPFMDLNALSPLRDRPDVRLHLDADWVWVRWGGSREAVVRCLLPVPGIEFFTRNGGEWYPFARRIPLQAGPPKGEGDSLPRHLSPEPIRPTWPTNEPLLPISPQLVRGGEVRPTTALSCDLEMLHGWARRATTAELAHVGAARSGKRVLLRGDQLPAIATAVRYWGTTLFVPLGFHIAPDLPSALIRDAVGATNTEIVVFDESGIEIIPNNAFAPLTRAAVRG